MSEPFSDPFLEILLSFDGANRDPEVFEDPDCLDILTPGSRVQNDLQVFRQRGMFDRSSNLPVEIAL